MTERLLRLLRRLFRTGVLAAVGPFLVGAVHASAMISVGTPTTSVPTYLSDGSYLYGSPVTLGTDQFLLPVQISGAAGLQNWQFDLIFDNAVVQVVDLDPFDGNPGIYGAQFASGDADSLSFIFGGFPFNDLGLVDDVAGSHPNLISGATGDGVLAFVLFEYLVDRTTDEANFGIENPVIIQQQAPEPGTMMLLAVALVTLAWNRRRQGRLPISRLQ